MALEAQVKQLEANAASFASNAPSPGSPRTPTSPGGNARNVKPPWMTEPPGSRKPQKRQSMGRNTIGAQIISHGFATFHHNVREKESNHQRAGQLRLLRPGMMRGLSTSSFRMLSQPSLSRMKKTRKASHDGAYVSGGTTSYCMSLTSPASFCISLDSTTAGYPILRVHAEPPRTIFNQADMLNLHTNHTAKHTHWNANHDSWIAIWRSHIYLTNSPIRLKVQ